ncbi:MAG: helix-turn-helix transcriptional regulator [Bacteroidia bacterium]
MPKNKDAISRYFIIDECLTNKKHPFPSLNYIKEKIEEKLDKSVGIRTIQKDLEDLRNDNVLKYYAPIKYSKIHEGYYYEDENYSIRNFIFNEKELDAMEVAVDILNSFREVGFVDEFNNAVDKIFETISAFKKRQINYKKIIDFEKSSSVLGVSILPQLINSIRMLEVISFNYFSYEKETLRKITLSPYLLKEYRNRWYLIGWSNCHSEIRTFGVDRISDLKILNKEKYVFSKNFNPDEFFKYAFGITINRFKPEKFHFITSVQEFRYYSSNYIHHSQKVVKQDKHSVEFSIEVYPCFELKSFVLGNLGLLKVIKPKWFVDEINETVSNYLKQI